MSSMSRNERRKEKFNKIKHPPKQEKQEKWGKNSILLISSFAITFLLLVGITTFNSELSNFFNSNDKKAYQTTNATIYSYETKTMLQQTKIGNTNIAVGYLVKYRYNVNGKIYDHEETLSMLTKSTYLIYIAKNLNTESFLVQYDTTHPEKAFLEQKE